MDTIGTFGVDGQIGRPVRTCGVVQAISPASFSARWLQFCPSRSAETLGKLVALYEHSVFTQGVIWDLERGKPSVM